MDTNSQVARLDHDQWQVRIFMTWDEVLHSLAGRADQQSSRCRIALPRGLRDPAEAIASLRDRAREFIADWHRRDHHAHSEFSEL